MRNENEFTKEFEALGPVAAKRRFRQLVGKHHPDRNGDSDKFRAVVEAYRSSAIEPVVRVGSRVKARGRWWTVVAANNAFGLSVKGRTPGRFTIEEKKLLKRNEVKEVRQGRRGEYVLLRRADWLRLKREKLT